MSCGCDTCECRAQGKVAIDLEEYEWLQSTAEVDVHLRDAAGRVADMGLDPDFKPSDEFRMWLKRIKAALKARSTA
jgi:hypothetical protein